MNKKIFLILIVLAIFASSCSLLSDNLSKEQIFSLATKNEELLDSVIFEIKEFQTDIKDISTTQKSKIYNSDYADLQGLYISKYENGQTVYEVIDNEIFNKVMELKGLISISIQGEKVEFFLRRCRFWFSDIILWILLYGKF